MAFDEESIFAPITSVGVGAVSVVRISGRRTKKAVVALCKRSEEILANPRKLIHTEVFDRFSQPNEEIPTTLSAKHEVLSLDPLDRALVVFFPEPASFTGEDSAEFQLHASPFVIERLQRNLSDMGLRPAGPGEFSKRAFLNGKIDLLQAEAIRDLIAAKGEIQARLANEQLSGKLAHAVEMLKEPLQDLLSRIEALLDFADDEPDVNHSPDYERAIKCVCTRMDSYIDSYERGRLLREGARVVIAGPPNAGKSSLLNRLLGEERAIVTDTAGTTRDHLEEAISIDGMLVVLSDTAGLRVDVESCAEKAELLGMERTWKQIETGDVCLFVIDLTERKKGVLDILEQVEKSASRVIVVGNKLDLLPPEKRRAKNSRTESELPAEPIRISALTGEGVDSLKNAITTSLTGGSFGTGGEEALVCNQRHLDALREARKALSGALETLSQTPPPLELTAADLRDALRALGEILGTTTSEDILGRIFSSFCIGK